MHQVITRQSARESRTPRRPAGKRRHAGGVCGRTELAPQYRRWRGAHQNTILAVQSFVPAAQLLAEYINRESI
jgi:hypothetical protein